MDRFEREDPQHFPLVSLVLVAYQQEKFVRCSVRSLLAQDYPNLEIILSDDCSSDGTFAILRDEVARYQGPHHVIARQTERNFGLVSHFFSVARTARGRLVVAAAGDDISHAHRVSRLVDLWRSTGADAVVSSWNQINSDGQITASGDPGKLNQELTKYFPGQEVRQITGAAAAYSADVFKYISPPDEAIFAEDMFITLMLHWRGRHVAYTGDRLVDYRCHDRALTHVARESLSNEDRELEGERAAERNYKMLKVFEGIISRRDPADWGPWGQPKLLNRVAIAEDIAFECFRSAWTGAPTFTRLRTWASLADRSHRRWLMPRVFGLTILRMVRRFRHFGQGV